MKVNELIAGLRALEAENRAADPLAAGPPLAPPWPLLLLLVFLASAAL